MFVMICRSLCCFKVNNRCRYYKIKKYCVVNVNEYCLENNVVILMYVICFSKDIFVNSFFF